MIVNGLFFIARMTPGLDNYLMGFLALWPLQAGIGILPTDPFTFYPWQLVSYMFLHSTASIFHLFFNLFVLWMFGQSIENQWGTRRFTYYYFLTGIGAGILHLIVNLGAGPIVPTIGASGAVYGILLAFAVMYPNREIFLIFLPIPIKAKYFVIILGTIEFISGVTGLQTGIAHFAHLGGMLVGYMLIKAWGVRGGYE